MQLTQIVKYVLPPIVVDPARWLLARWPLRAPETGHVSIHYKLVSEWTTAKEGTGTFDFEVAKRSVDWELGVCLSQARVCETALQPSLRGGNGGGVDGVKKGVADAMIKAEHSTISGTSANHDGSGIFTALSRRWTP